MNNLRIIITFSSRYSVNNFNYTQRTFMFVKFKSKKEYKQIYFLNDKCYMSKFIYRKLGKFVNRMRKYVIEIKHVKVWN